MRMQTIHGLAVARVGIATLHYAKNTYPDSADTVCGRHVMCSAFFASEEAGLAAMSRFVETKSGYLNTPCSDCLRSGVCGV